MQVPSRVYDILVRPDALQRLVRDLALEDTALGPERHLLQQDLLDAGIDFLALGLIGLALGR